MSKYTITIFVICLLVGVLEKISYGGKKDISKLALSIITLYVVISPIAVAVRNFDFEDILGSEQWEGESFDEGYIQVAEEAFARGIAQAVEEKFELEKGSVKVALDGFDFEMMRSEKIKITLTGRSVSANYRGIEKYVNDMEIGKCEVVVEIG